MAESFKVGDLAMVVKPMYCCGNTSGLGKIFTVIPDSGRQFTRCTHCGHRRRKDSNSVMCSDDSNREGSRLKKIDPPPIADTVKRDTEITA